MFIPLLLAVSIFVSTAKPQTVEQNIVEQKKLLKKTDDIMSRMSIYHNLYVLYIDKNDYDLAGQCLTDYLGDLDMFSEFVYDTPENEMGKEKKKVIFQMIDEKKEAGEALLNCVAFKVYPKFGREKFKPVIINTEDQATYFVSDKCANICGGKIEKTKQLGLDKKNSIMKIEFVCHNKTKQIWFFDIKNSKGKETK